MLTPVSTGRMTTDLGDCKAMAMSDYTGGIGALLWTVLGLIVGLGIGWFYGSYFIYGFVGAVLGWLGGIALAGSEEAHDDHH